MAKVPKLVYKRVDVTWLDAVSGDGWVNVDDLSAPAVCHTRGFLIRDLPEYIVVAGTIDKENPELVGDVLTIPKVMITQMKQRKR